MKKLLGISLVAIMSVSAANAEIASKAYVDQQDDAVEAIVTALSGKVGTVPEDKTVVGMIAEAQTAATYDDTALAGRVTAAENAIDAIEESAYATSGITSTLVGKITANETAIGDANSGLTKAVADNASDIADLQGAVNDLGETYATDQELTAGLATKQDTLSSAQQAAVDSGITSTLVGKITTNETAITTLNGNAQTEGSVDYKIAAAQSNLQNAIDEKVDANNAITASSANSIVQYDAKGLVLSGTAAGALAVKDTVATADIDANAVTLAKLSASLPEGCQGQGAECVLKSSNGALAWEVIQRANNGQ